MKQHIKEWLNDDWCKCCDGTKSLDGIRHPGSYEDDHYLKWTRITLDKG